MPISEYAKQDPIPLAEMLPSNKVETIVGGDQVTRVTLYEISVLPRCPAAVQRILENDLPVWLDLFQMKSREYGDNADNLGPKGQFADMSRKMGKLRRALWDGHEDELTTETVEEILLDLIGHCFLTIDQRRRGVQ